MSINNSASEHLQYPFENPIIVLSDNAIYDGQHRFEVCKKIGAMVECLRLDYTSDDVKNPEFIKEIRKIKEAQRVKLESFFKKNDIHYLKQIEYVSSTDRITKFIQFKSKFTNDKEYWRHLKDHYTTSDNNFIYRSELKELFTANRKRKEYLMSGLERNFINTLPPTIKIFRGMSEVEFNSNDFGISWTLKKHIAEKYANDFTHNYDTIHLGGKIKELTINKSQIVAFFDNRKEYEIIYIHTANNNT